MVADGSQAPRVANLPRGEMSVRVAVMVSGASATRSALTVTATVRVVSRGPKVNVNRVVPVSSWRHSVPRGSE